MHGQILADRTSPGQGFQLKKWLHAYHMHLLPSVAIRPNLELKTRSEQLLGSLPLVIALPVMWVEVGVKCPKLNNLILTSKISNVANFEFTNALYNFSRMN